MLGRLYAAEGDYSPTGAAAANAWFQRTRELARAGFADSLGPAADSYGWEADGEMALEHPRRAAELYLAELATGQASALDGLKEVVPRTDEDWRAAAADPLLRRITSMHRLAFGGYAEKPEEALATNKRWLALLQELQIKETEGAEYLGWIAYQAGDYDLAARWLRLAKSDSPAALWLQAKLFRRAGKTTEAAQAMLRAWKTLQNPALYTRWDHPAEPRDDDDDGRDYDPAYFSVFSSGEGEIMQFSQQAGGDYGALRLSRGEFVPALEAFRKAGFWDDAAYIAEEVLTTNELVKYVAGLPPEPPRLVRVPDERNYEEVRYRSMRHLLGRRLMRDGRYAEARKYLPEPYDQLARQYAEALHDAQNLQHAKVERAHTWFRAGWLARYAGMELMGTEGEPDSYATRGDFPDDELAAERTARRYKEVKYDAPGSVKEALRPLAVQATDAELKRLRKTRVEPPVRFHYRLIGVDHMMKAARLLPDNSEDLADVLNRAGRIAADLVHGEADAIYQQLERRCAQTRLGQAATKVRWFVAESGRWSLEEKAALDRVLARKPPPPEQGG